VALLHTEDLSVGYAGPRRAVKTVAASLQLTLQAGQLTCLLGPNGAGKSTLLRALAGLQKPLEGRVLMGGQDIYTLTAMERARRLAVVLTERLSVGQLRGTDLVALGRAPYTAWDGRLNNEDWAVVEWAIQAVQAEPLAPRLVEELSDGERQRLLIARALAQQPDVLILDEPTAFLDVIHRVEAFALLRRLTRETKLAVVLSTHELDLARKAADQLWLIAPGEGFHSGAPDTLAPVLDRIFHLPPLV
jgi:iron complex transport system ATP-binding protein